MTTDDHESLVSLIKIHADDVLMTALEFPAYDATQPALTALHAGAAFHRLAVLHEVAESYRTQACLTDADLPFIAIIDAAARGMPARQQAQRFYKMALSWDNQLAEAWYGIARLRQHEGSLDAALDGFSRAAELPHHFRTPGHASLRANAFFGRACILEDLGRDDEALTAYRQALSLLDNFGVHHRRIADFFRRHGLTTEAIQSYEKLMAYGHRYFPEFTLPPLKAPPTLSPTPDTLETLLETSDGASIVFWQGAYYRIPRELVPMASAKLEQLTSSASPPDGLIGIFHRLLGLTPGLSKKSARQRDLGIRKADNMIVLEPARDGSA